MAARMERRMGDFFMREVGKECGALAAWPGAAEKIRSEGAGRFRSGGRNWVEKESMRLLRGSGWGRGWDGN